MGCGPSRDSHAKNGVNHKEKWADLKKRLPRNRVSGDQERRVALFKEFDPTNSGFLTQAQCLTGCKAVLFLDEMTSNLSLLVQRAYASAQERGGPAADDAIKKDRINLADFRLFLVYLYDYFELWVMFQDVDVDADTGITQEEFTKAVPTIEEWGVHIEDPTTTFNLVDTNGGGTITFDEFCHWAIRQHLDADGTTREVTHK